MKPFPKLDTSPNANVLDAIVAKPPDVTSEVLGDTRTHLVAPNGLTYSLAAAQVDRRIA